MLGRCPRNSDFEKLQYLDENDGSEDSVQSFLATAMLKGVRLIEYSPSILCRPRYNFGDLFAG